MRLAATAGMERGAAAGMEGALQSLDLPQVWKADQCGKTNAAEHTNAPALITSSITTTQRALPIVATAECRRDAFCPEPLLVRCRGRAGHLSSLVPMPQTKAATARAMAATSAAVRTP